MTKDQIVSDITDANTELVFALLCSWLPVLKFPLFAYVVKYYIRKGMRPEVNEGVVLVAFKVIDWEQMAKASNFAAAMKTLRDAVLNGGSDDEIQKADTDFDNAFRNAISGSP